jgi:hypothetical protein
MPLTTETRQQIFDTISTILRQQCPPMVISKDKKDVLEIMGNKAVPYGSKKTIVPGMYFSSVVARKDMVSYYFFPIYYHTDDFINLIPTLAKYLKGKTCFNFKNPGQVNEKELKALLKKGVQAWKKMGYMQ